MASAYAKRLQKLADEIPSDFTTEATVQVLIDDNNELADTAIVLLSGSILDSALQSALLGKMVELSNDERQKLFDYDKRGPLSDFSAKIKMGYALDLYGPKTRDDLDKIRRIRNHFAHANQHWSFENVVIAEIADSLYIHTTISLLGAQFGQANPKARFATACAAIASRLRIGIRKKEGKFQTLAELLGKTPLLP